VQAFAVLKTAEGRREVVSVLHPNGGVVRSSGLEEAPANRTAAKVLAAAS